MIEMPRAASLRMMPNSTLRLALGERRRRLVEDQDAAVERQRLGDLDQLLAGDGERLDQDGRVDGAQLRQRLAGAARSRPGSP